MASKQMMEKVIIGLAIVAFILIGFVFLKVSSIGNAGNAPVNTPPASNNNVNLAVSEVLPKGIPRIYGAELGVSYDDVSAADQKKADATISTLGRLDTSIKLSGNNLDRYKKIALQISCEYCCGTDSIISKSGEAACGCAHSYAMRGVAKYLITKHPAEFTDDQILEEMAKWKALFFPAQIAKKAGVLKSKGIEASYINLGSNKYRNIEG